MPRGSLWPMPETTCGSQTDGRPRRRPLWQRDRRGGRANWPVATDERAGGGGPAGGHVRPSTVSAAWAAALLAARAAARAGRAARRRRARRPRPGPSAAAAAAHPAPGRGRAVDAPRAGRRPPINRRCRGTGPGAAAGRAQPWALTATAADRAARRRRPPRRGVGKRQVCWSEEMGGWETHPFPPWPDRVAVNLLAVCLPTQSATGHGQRAAVEGGALRTGSHSSAPAQPLGRPHRRWRAPCKGAPRWAAGRVRGEIWHP